MEAGQRLLPGILPTGSCRRARVRRPATASLTAATATALVILSLTHSRVIMAAAVTGCDSPPAGQRRRGLRPRCATSLPTGVVALASQNSATFLVRCRRPTELAKHAMRLNPNRKRCTRKSGRCRRRLAATPSPLLSLDTEREAVIGSCRATCAEARASLKARDEIFDPAGCSSQQGVKRFLGFCTIWRNK
jgi:hypothetical protein